MMRERVVLAAVVAHLVLTVLHGVVHAAIPVFPTGRVALFAALSLYLLPVGGAGLVMGGYRRIGALVLLGAGLVGFGLEGVFHFVVANPDHVAHVFAHRTAFGLTAVLTTVGDLLLVGAAWYSLRDSRGAVTQRAAATEG